MEKFQLNDREYEVLRLLGKGKGGYSYLVTDGERKYVLKQLHHEPCDYYSFGDKFASEMQDYEKLTSLKIRMPALLEADRERERLLKEYIEGPTVYEMLLEGLSVQQQLKQLKSMCDSLYPAGINIDYFPTNFVVNDGLLYYIDFECNDYMQQWDLEHWGIKYWSKTPEFLDYAQKRGDI